MLPGVLLAVGSVAAVFFSHPDESNIVAKISATNVERNVVFTGLTRIEQHGNLQDGRNNPRGCMSWKVVTAAVHKRTIGCQMGPETQNI